MHIYFSRKHFFNYANKHPLFKFIIVLSIFLAYLVITVYKFGISNGFLITALTWSFFVFCTPIADAGILLDFPLRLLLNIRMLYSEIFVWIVAFLINFFAFIFYPESYNKTMLLMFFKKIILTPWPFWLIIFLSAIGTFLSIIFGDEVLDVIESKKKSCKKYNKHKLKYHLILYISVLLLVLLLYMYLIENFNIPIRII